MSDAEMRDANLYGFCPGCGRARRMTMTRTVTYEGPSMERSEVRHMGVTCYTGMDCERSGLVTD